MSEQLKTVPNGVVVLFEGIDGAGKTTQLELAASALRDQSWLVHTARAHGGTPIGEALRKVSLDASLERSPKTDMDITIAIHQALSEDLEQWRQKGAVSLVDRGPLSLAAYQLYGDGLDRQSHWPVVEADLKLFSPELILTYDATVNIALERAKRRHSAADSTQADYFENKSAAYFQAVSRGFLEAAERFNSRLIDANQGIEEVHETTMGLIIKQLDARAAAK